MKYAEDFARGDVYDLGSHRMSDEEIIRFASEYDPQPYHISHDGGAQSSFGGLIASGWNTAAIWMRLYVANMLDGVIVHGSPGVDELRWYAPVRPGDVLHGQVEVLDLTPSLTQPTVMTVRKRGTLRTEGSDRPVCSLILHSRIERRPRDVSA